MSETLTQTLARNPAAGAGLAQGDALPLLDVSAAGLAKDAGLTILELMKALMGRNAQANAAGNSNVTLGVISLQHTEVVTFSGAGGTTRVVILKTDLGGAVAPVRGARCAIRCVMPATADITVEFRSGTAGGTLITSFITDGSGDDAVGEFEFDGAAWNFLRFNLPANA